MNGFVKVAVNKTELDNIIKKYKKIKKYMRSNYYEIKLLEKTETIVTELLEGSKPDD